VLDSSIKHQQNVFSVSGVSDRSIVDPPKGLGRPSYNHQYSRFLLCFQTQDEDSTTEKRQLMTTT
jgi:hypothetical protein